MSGMNKLANAVISISMPPIISEAKIPEREDLADIFIKLETVEKINKADMFLREQKKPLPLPELIEWAGKKIDSQYYILLGEAMVISIVLLLILKGGI